MTKWRGLVVLLIWPVLTAGCLTKDVTETWYVEANGSVTWSVLEANVRSDAESAVDRQAEETRYISAVGAQTHQVYEGLAELGPSELRTRIVRRSTPFTVSTEATFVDLGDLGRRLLGVARLAGTSLLEPTPEGEAWTMTLSDPRGPDVPEPDDHVNELLMYLDGLTVALAQGRFTSAEGFELSGDRRAATLITDDRVSAGFDAKGAVVLKLTWSNR